MREGIQFHTFGGPSESREVLGSRAPPRKHHPRPPCRNANHEDTAKHMPNQAKGVPLKKQTGCLPPYPGSFWLAAFPTNQTDTCALQQGDTPTSPPPQQSPNVWCVPVGLISARNMTHSSPGLVLSSTPTRVGGSKPNHLPFLLAKLLA